jgi:TonB-dependent receptor-like protein
MVAFVLSCGWSGRGSAEDAASTSNALPSFGLTDPQIVLVQQAEPPVAPPVALPEIPETRVEAQRVQPAPNFPNFQTVEPSGPTNRADSLIGKTPAASQGVYGRKDLETRPLFSPTNVLDAIPGFVSTAENTGADAGVYYIRGVNTEHGTDFALFVDDMPLNLPTHAHAQGFANMNFMIPELVRVVEYRKGSYYADLGDFSTLGAAKIELARTLPQSIDSISAGQYGWVRALTASSSQQWGGELLYAADLSYSDNGFDIPERNKRFKGLVKYTTGDEDEGSSTSLMAYHGDWFSTEAQPLSSIKVNGLYSNLDPTTGGRQSRFSWNTQYWRQDEYGVWKANAYAISDRFDLFINPEQVADEQVLQPDGRLIGGLNVARQFDLDLLDMDILGLPSPWTIGVQTRNDYINRLRRDRTMARQTLDVEESLRVNIFTVSPYIQNETRWTDWSRTVVGLRGDMYQFDVTDHVDPANSGDTSAGLANPKFSLILGPWDKTEYFLNLGTGFHSNDARDLFDPLMPTDPIARTKSAEVGLRSERFENWTTNVAVWYQEFASELVFNAEEGEPEALGPSRRYGVEWNNNFHMNQWLSWDLDWAWANVRFTNGDRVPLSLSNLLTTGPMVRLENGLYGTLRFQYFGPRPLVEDGSLFSNSVEVANLQVGYRRGQWQLAADVFNVFGSKDFAMTFAEGADRFVRPLDPTQARLTLTRTY